MEHNVTNLYMEYFKARLVEVRERGYAMFDCFVDTTNEDFFNIVELPFDQLEELGELDERTQLQFLNVVLLKLNWKDALNHTKERDWKTIFNHAIEEMDVPGETVVKSCTRKRNGSTCSC